MIVCICRNVSDKTIAATVASGVCSFEGLQQCTGVSTGCGKCLGHAKQVFDYSSKPQQAGRSALQAQEQPERVHSLERVHSIRSI